MASSSALNLPLPSYTTVPWQRALQLPAPLLQPWLLRSVSAYRWCSARTATRPLMHEHQRCDRPAARQQHSAAASAARPLPPAGSAEPTYVVRRNLRSGTAVSFPQGNVVVLGDVNSGSAVIAGGDIVVWGRLLGEAHAGVAGNRAAQVVCLELNPSRLQIDDVTSTGGTLAAAAELPPGPKSVYLGGPDASLQVGAGLLDAGDGWLSEQSSLRLRSCQRACILTGCYALLLGLLLVAAPAWTFGLLFDASKVPAGWIQVGGVLFATFGLQYLVTGLWPSFGVHDSVERQVWSRASSFFVASVVSRAFLVAMFGLLVALRRVEPALLVLAGVNLLGLLGMHAALNQVAKRKIVVEPLGAAGVMGLRTGLGTYVVGSGGVLLPADGDVADSSSAPVSAAERYMRRMQ